MRRVRRQVGRVGARRDGRRPAGRRRPGAARRPGAVRRRRDLPHRRHDGAGVDDRLLPAARRRPGRLRRDRRGQRVQRRVRDGRPRRAGDQRRRLPRALPAVRRWRRSSTPPRRSSPRPAAPSPAGTRSATPSRCSGSPCRASCTPTGCSARAAPGPATSCVLSKPLGTGLVARRRRPTTTRRRRSPGCGALNRAASEALQALGPAVHAVTDVTGYGLAGHGWEVAERSGVRLVDRRRRARRLPGGASRPPSGACAPAATPATATTSPATSTRAASATRRGAGARPADVRRPAGRGRPGAVAELVDARVLARRHDRGRRRRPWSCDDGSARRAAAAAAVVSKKRAPTRSVERELWDLGHDVVVGIDEVGRGAWAGPLTVGAVILPRDRRVNGIRDSKLLTEREREQLFDRVASWCVAWGVGSASQVECDELGMSAAQRLAAQRAIAAARRRARRRRRRRQLGLRVAARRPRRAAGQGRRPLPQRRRGEHPRQGRARPGDARARRALPAVVVRHQQGLPVPGAQGGAAGATARR